MVLAESVSIDPTALVLGLVLVLLSLVGLAVLVVLGFRVALRAGRGDAPVTHLVVVLGLEVLLLVVSARLDLLGVVLGGALVAQAALFLLARPTAG